MTPSASVSAKRDMYGPGAGYNVRLALLVPKSKLIRPSRDQVFAGKDGSRGLGKSSLKPEDAVADYSTLDESEVTVLDDWVKYFTKVRSLRGGVGSRGELTEPRCRRGTTSLARLLIEVRI